MKFQKNFLILIVFYLHLSVVITQEAFPFPRILWTYWDSGQTKLQKFTQLCINNMRHYANISNWEFRFLSDQTIYNYISLQGQERIARMMTSKTIHLERQSRADILRLHLIYENGGMWLDTNSIFLNNFSWIENIDKQVNITNKIGAYPDYLAFTSDYFFQKRTKYFDEQLGIQIVFYPPVQIWFILAKKKAQFLKDVLQNIDYTLTKTISQLYDENRKMGIQGEIGNYFIASNYQFQTILQRKQLEINAYPQKFKTKYAVNYYKLWTIKSQNSALALLLLGEVSTMQIYKLMHYSLQSLTKKYNIRSFIFKFSSHQYHKLSKNIQKLTPSLCGTNQRLFEENSILNQYVFKPSMHLEEIQFMSTLNFEDRIQVNQQLCATGQQIRIIVQQIYKIMFFLLCGALSLCLFVYYANIIPELETKQTKSYYLPDEQN